MIPGSIGVFDSGYGGLTVLKALTDRLPNYDYIYLGDNARAPYGNRSFETVKQYTLQSVKTLFDMGCNLIILACNTASAKALRSIQQEYLPQIEPYKRVLGVIRPTTELAGSLTKSGAVGIMATSGTVQSDSYPIEIHKFFPNVSVFQQACPLLVPLIENNAHNTEGAQYFIKQYTHELMAQNSQIDTVILGCTHYPLIANQIQEALPSHVNVYAQGQIVADSLQDYLSRHPQLEALCLKGESRRFFTTDSTSAFNQMATIFYNQQIQSQHIEIA